jgi:hypothetical protein
MFWPKILISFELPSSQVLAPLVPFISGIEEVTQQMCPEEQPRLGFTD